MLDEIRNIKCAKNDLRKFGITVGVILIAIARILFWKEKQLFEILISIGAVLFVTGLTMTVILKPIYWIWMIFAIIIGWIMTRVILSLIFYIIFTPIGLTARLFGKRFLVLRCDRMIDSYWNYRTINRPNQESYENQF